MNPAPSRTRAQVTGGEAEGDAARFLERHGLRLVARNYRTRFGEIDLIAMDGEVLVFVEVRMRSSGRFGGALESVTAGKQRRIASAAGHFLQRYPGEPRCRFDVVVLQEGPPQWHKAAFEAG
jgi:putative endonuclease